MNQKDSLRMTDEFYALHLSMDHSEMMMRNNWTCILFLLSAKRSSWEELQNHSSTWGLVELGLL